MFFLKHFQMLESFIFFGMKAQVFGDKKTIVYVPYLAVFGFLAYNHYACRNEGWDSTNKTHEYKQ